MQLKTVPIPRSGFFNIVIYFLKQVMDFDQFRYWHGVL